MRHKEQGGTVVGIFVGLVVGVAVAAVVIWYTNQMPTPFAEKEQAARIDTSGGPVNLPGKPGDAAPKTTDAAKPATSAPTAGTPAEAAPETPPVAPGKRHYLQAGSFSNPNEADNMRATLAIRGMESSVRQVILKDKTYYRIVLGPYEKIEDAKESRAELARLGVETLVIQE